MIDRTGGGDHFEVIVHACCSSTTYRGSSSTNRIYAALDEPEAGHIHELWINTKGTAWTGSDKIQELRPELGCGAFMKGTPDAIMCGNSERALGTAAGWRADHGS